MQYRNRKTFMYDNPPAKIKIMFPIGFTNRKLKGEVENEVSNEYFPYQTFLHLSNRVQHRIIPITTAQR